MKAIINGIRNYDLEPHQRLEYCETFLELVKAKIYPLGDEGETVGMIELSASEKISIEAVAGILVRQLEGWKKAGRKRDAKQSVNAKRQSEYRARKLARLKP